MPKGVIDIYLLYEFIKRLTTPFEKWPAFEAGVIDSNGKVLIKSTNRTKEQDKTWGYYDKFVANLKKLLGKIPGGKSRIASFAAALLLLKENIEDPDDLEYLEECLLFYIDEAESLLSETNVAGSGNIAGIGVGPEGFKDPPISGVVLSRHRQKNKKQIEDILKQIKSIHNDSK